MVELICVDPERVQEVWPHVQPLLREAILRTGLGTIKDIESDVLYGDALVWIAWNGNTIEAAASTILQVTDAGLVCRIMACGGTDMRRWTPLLHQIEQYAKNEGCKCTRIIGRKGWLRVLDGYREKHVVMDKELN